MRPQTSASPPPATPPAPIGQVSDGTANRRDAEWLSDARWYYELHEKRNNSAQTRAVPVMAFSAADPLGAILGRHVDCLASDVLTGAALTLVNGSDSM